MSASTVVVFVIMAVFSGVMVQLREKSLEIQKAETTTTTKKGANEGARVLK